jgi:hypothetical protein
MKNKANKSIAIAMTSKEHDEISDLLYMMKRFDRIKGVGYGTFALLSMSLVKDLYNDLSEYEKKAISDIETLKEVIRKKTL